MVISPYNAAVSPYTMPPCSCASIWPTFTVGPQSTAHTTRCTRTDPSAPTDTSATCAHTVGAHSAMAMPRPRPLGTGEPQPDRKSTRLNSSHLVISYAVFCLKKKKKKQEPQTSNIRTEDTESAVTEYTASMNPAPTQAHHSDRSH